MAAPTLHAGTAVEDQLNAWAEAGFPIRCDIDTAGIRLQIAPIGAAHMYLEYIAVAVAVAERRTGTGTAVMRALTGWADQHQLTISLGADPAYGTPKRVLDRFYRRHGFTRDRFPNGYTRTPKIGA